MKRPYLILTGLLAFVFVYVLVNNVAKSYSETLSKYAALKNRRGSLIDPAELPVEKSQLVAERSALSKEILKSQSRYRQSQVGVIQCVTDNARHHRVVLESFSPGREVRNGQFSKFHFSLDVRASFLRLGSFVNSIENAGIPIGIDHIKIVSNPIGESVLTAHIQATATLHHGFGQAER